METEKKKKATWFVPEQNALAPMGMGCDLTLYIFQCKLPDLRRGLC